MWRRARSAATTRWRDACNRSAQFDRIDRAVRCYRHQDVALPVLTVVYRALFLTICVLLVLLYVLSRITSLLPGVNEIVIPTMTLPTDVDLGLAVNDAFWRSSGAIFDVLGVLTLVISATLTARALRKGSDSVLRDGPGPTRRWSYPRDFVTGIGVGLVVLLAWLLVLVTAVRTSALRALAGWEIPRVLVQVGKAGLIIAALVVVAAAVYVFLGPRSSAKRRDLMLAALTVAGFVIVADFVLLYTYLAALVDPDTSAGVVLVMAILAWVNMVVRALFYAECWLAVGPGREVPAGAVADGVE